MQQKFQMLITYLSFLGVTDEYLKLRNKWESNWHAHESIEHINIKYGIRNTAVYDSIVKKAKSQRIVMINENHFYPNHRLFVKKLLPRLQKIGFNYLALEALWPKQDSVLNSEHTFPTIKTGFYIREQNYANMVRLAQQLNMKFVAYEQLPNSTLDREQAQAENLYSKTFGIDTTAKVIVLAGLGHILEKKTKKGEKWMATAFKEKYNIDPLTISQVHLYVRSNELTDTLTLIKSNHFADNHTKSSVDYHLINNVKFDRKAFPDFIYKNSYDQPVQVSLFFEEEIKTKKKDYI